MVITSKGFQEEVKDIARMQGSFSDPGLRLRTGIMGRTFYYDLVNVESVVHNATLHFAILSDIKIK